MPPASDPMSSQTSQEKILHDAKTSIKVDALSMKKSLVVFYCCLLGC